MHFRRDPAALLPRLRVLSLPPVGPTESFSEAVLGGLGKTPKTLPPRFLYDAEGSRLFEEITRLPEYYLTRCEEEILRVSGPEIAAAMADCSSLVEFGSGSSWKTRRLLDLCLARRPKLHYYAIDISSEFLLESASGLLRDYPTLWVTALAGEYYDAFPVLGGGGDPRLFIFLGSNIGNFTPEEARGFLKRLHTVMDPHDRLLIGVDLVKDPTVIEAAYNDSRGITADFNKNILRRINRELHGNFDLDRFAHHAPYDPVEQRVEMRLVSACDQSVEVGGREFQFAQDEPIVTEWSHKYTPDCFERLCRSAGLTRAASWRDSQGYFSLKMVRPA